MKLSAKELRDMGGLEGLHQKAAEGTLPEKPKPKKTKSVPTEHEEQVAFFKWAGGWLPSELFELLFAVPNGGHRHKAVAGKLKAEGVKPGAPDIFYAWSRLGYHGLFIEMKRLKDGRLSEYQNAFHKALRYAGFLVVVCKGADEAAQAMRDYMIGSGKEFDQ